MDIVYIKELRVDTVIGVYDWERDIRQAVVLDLELASDNRRVASHDRIEDAVDYDAISSHVCTFIEGSKFKLIETLAEQVGQHKNYVELLFGQHDS